MPRINQCAKVLNYLMRHGRITRKAAERMGVKDLTYAVWMLRHMTIITEEDHYRIVKPIYKPQARVPFEDDLFPDYENE